MPRFAAAQFEPQLLDKSTNLENILNLVDEAAQQNVDLIVFPECSLTGYTLTPEEAQTLAEPENGPSARLLLEKSRTVGMRIAIGMLEKDEHGNLFNAAFLFGPTGLEGSYRKTHLPMLGVDRYLMQGAEIPAPIETPLGRLGMLICYDLRFPEPLRVLALAGAQVVLLPTNWPEAASLYPEFMLQSRAAENRVFIVAANRVGEERGTHYLGRSVIVSPEGSILAEGSTSQTELLLADIQPARADQKKLIFVPGEYELDLIHDRRPDLYQSLGDETELT
jgi:5-aminopentanamidase